MSARLLAAATLALACESETRVDCRSYSLETLNTANALLCVPKA